MEKKTKKTAVKKTTKKATTKKVVKKDEVKKTKKKKKGFTLIELLAVIIILGILMIVAIPSVTKYINDSRKSSYVDTAKEVVAGTRNMVNDGHLRMYDTGTTYYIPVDYIKTENALKSPYGEFTQAYVGVIYDGKGYKYYWISTDDAGEGISKITFIDKLNEDDIESDLNSDDILKTVKTTGIGNRKTIRVLDSSNNSWDEYNAEQYIDEEGNVLEPKICVTKNMYSIENKVLYDYTQGMTVLELLEADIIDFDDGEEINSFYEYEFYTCYDANPYTGSQYQNWSNYMRQCRQYGHYVEYTDQVINANVGCYFVSLPK